MEILLEEIRDKVNLVAEGHEVLEKKIDLNAKKIDFVHRSLKDEIRVTGHALKDEINRVEHKLDQHLKVQA